MGKTWKRLRYLVFLVPENRWGVNVETIMGAYMTVFKNRETPTWTLERCSSGSEDLPQKNLNFLEGPKKHKPIIKLDLFCSHHVFVGKVAESRIQGIYGWNFCFRLRFWL